MIQRLLLSIMLCIIFTACKDSGADQSQKKTTVYVVQLKKQQQDLFFNGIIQPKSIFNVSSPVEGNVQKKFFRFGQHVEKEQKLLIIDSEKLEADYQQALTDFLKAKEAFTISQGKWRGVQELKNLGFLSKNQYTDELHTREENTLTYYQARKKLEETLRKTNRDVKEVMSYLNQLSLNDIEQVSNALSSDQDSLILRAPASGVVLYPEKKGSDDNAGVDLSKGVVMGTPLKTGDVICAIGDLKGMSVKFKVNEVNILKLKLGQKVTVTGVAFPSLTLRGEIENIDSQASMGENGMPVFGVEVVIPDITKEVLSKVHIGMSARVQLTIETKPVMQVPINAVSQDVNGNSSVQLQIANGNTVKTQVETGTTDLTQVVILNGLKPGDKILVPTK